jgi:hypothetical protein
MSNEALAVLLEVLFAAGLASWLAYLGWLVYRK